MRAARPGHMSRNMERNCVAGLRLRKRETVKKRYRNRQSARDTVIRKNMFIPAIAFATGGKVKRSPWGSLGRPLPFITGYLQIGPRCSQKPCIYPISIWPECFLYTRRRRFQLEAIPRNRTRKALNCNIARTGSHDWRWQHPIWS